MIISALDVAKWPALSCLVSSPDVAGGLQKVRSTTAMNFFTFYFSSLGSFITSQLNDQLSAGSLAQVVERCTGIAEFKVLNSLPAWIFLGFPCALQKLRLSLMIVFTWNTTFFLLCLFYALLGGVAVLEQKTSKLWTFEMNCESEGWSPS